MATPNKKPPAGEPLVRGPAGLPSTAWMSFFQDMADRLAVLETLNTTTSYANDAAAAAGGVTIGSLYRNGSAVMVRVA